MNPAVIAALLRYGIPAAMGVGKGIETYQQTGDIGKAATSGLFTGGATLGLGALGEFAAPRLAGAIWGKIPNAAGASGLATFSPELAQAGQAGARQMSNAVMGTKLLSNTLPGLTQALGSPLAGGLGNVAASMTPGVFGPRSGDSSGQGGSGFGRTAQDVTGAVLGASKKDSEMVQPQYTAGTGLNPDDYLQGAWGMNNPIGQMQATLGLVGQMDRQRMQLANQYQNFALQAGDTAKSRDLQRNAAMAALKTQLGTQQSLIVNGQQQGASMANQAIADTGALARTQFSY
jgi:hypothetical protein